jgi:hypothetical protein
MQKIYETTLSVEKFIKNSRELKYPTINTCHKCGARDTFKPNGFYDRNVLTNDNEYIVSIRRFKCPHCSASVSFLPSFLIPYFQSTLERIISILKSFISKKKEGVCYYRQICYFYKKRFLINLNLLIMLFRDLDMSFLSKKEKATNLIERISIIGSNLSQRFIAKFNKSFMAN